MVAKVHALGRSFAGVAAYCLHDAPEPDEGERAETDERVEWADTRNLASRPERAAAQMAATAKAAPELKRLAGGSAAGRKLEKPVLHYTLSWGKDERPDRAEMNRAAEETLKALGLERHQALIVAHRDKDHPHLHMIANRVNPETGKAAKLGNDRLKLANWAERWERDRGGIKCPERVTLPLRVRPPPALLSIPEEPQPCPTDPRPAAAGGHADAHPASGAVVYVFPELLLRLRQPRTAERADVGPATRDEENGSQRAQSDDRRSGMRPPFPEG